MNATLTVGTSPAALERVLNIAAVLDTAAKLEAQGEYRRRAGYISAAIVAERSVEGALSLLGEPPSVARLRAAVILLSGITDDTLVQVTDRYRAKLAEALERVDAGEL